MTDLYYQSSEWIEIQKEMHEDENSKSIMDEFEKPTTENLTYTKLDTRNNLEYNLQKVDTFTKNGYLYIEYKLQTVTVMGATADRLKNTYTVIAEVNIDDNAPAANSLYQKPIAAIVETHTTNFSTLTQYGVLDLANEILLFNN